MPKFFSHKNIFFSKNYNKTFLKEKMKNKALCSKSTFQKKE